MTDEPRAAAERRRILTAIRGQPRTKKAALGFWLALGILALSVWSYVYLEGGRHPKPWNSSAIRATYYRTAHYGDKLDFEYVLENTTRDDLFLSDRSQFDVAIRVADTDSLRGFGSKQTTLQLPAYIPAKHRTTIVIETPEYQVGAIYPGADATKQDKDRFYASVAKEVSEKLSNWNGFVIFIKNPRYEIDLPNGWKSQGSSSSKSAVH